MKLENMIAIAAMGLLAAASAGAQLIVAKDGAAQAQIVVAADAAPAVRYAAEELQRWLGEMGGAPIPMVTDDAPQTPHEIVVGPGKRLDALALGIDPAALGGEEYVLRSAGPHLAIVGGAPRGTLYGAYGLLEDHLGCRWFTTQVNRIPKRNPLALPALDERFKPRLEYREPFVKECFDGDWCARNRMNGNTATLEERHGGKVTYFGFVHTFDALVPPDQYFDAHPEYFSLIDGQRRRERTQLCCTNEDVIRIVTEGVRRWMRDNPAATVFSVSQNDWFNQCKCDACQALATAEDSQIAPVLAMVNRVADAVRNEFPDKVVDTLAYQWTRKPPKTMRPAPNVVIRLCSIECCFSHAFEACDHEDNVAFVEDVKGWSKQCDRLWVWDYTTSFAHYLVPFPNLRVRAPNIRFFADHSVTGIFEQDVYNTFGGEFAELSGYLGAKLLWNPDYDPERAVDEFLDGVYGKAAPYLRRYLDLLHGRAEAKNIHVKIWVGPDSDHLNGVLLAKADRLFERAEAAVADAPDTLARVRLARSSVDYAVLERTRYQGQPAYIIDHGSFTVRQEPKFRARVERFFETAERNNISTWRESNGDMAAYKAQYLGMTADQQFTPRAADAVGALDPGLRYAYYEGAWNDVPDFATLTPLAEGIAQHVGLEVLQKRDAVGLRFAGYVHAERDGLYAFTLQSNDGSRLYIGDALVADNGGLHAEEGKTGFVALRAGYHPIAVSWFDAGAAEALRVLWSGPGLEQRPLPARALFHAP